MRGRTATAGPMLGLGAICVAAFLLRLLPIVLVPNLHQPDEVFQSIEQAHRLVYGNGVIPWEFQYGARSWLVPGAIAGIMWLARFWGDGPAYYLPAIFAVLSLLSTSCVVVAFLWGRRFYGLAGAFIAAWAMALSVDAIYFGPRAGQEEIAAHLLVLATYLAEPGYRPQSRWRLVGAGLIFGLVFTVRFHLAPAIALIVLWTSWRAWRARLLPLVAGALAATLAGGLLDWPSWGFPFASVWYNFDYNILYGVNAWYGTPGWEVYPALLLFVWSGGVAVILLLAALGCERLPLLGAAALLTVVQYALLPHKEYRLIFPAVLMAALLASLGLARSAVWVERQLRIAGLIPADTLHVSGLAAGLFWLVFAIGEASSAGYLELWGQDEDALLASLDVAKSPDVCGIALYGFYGVTWARAGGYSYLHHPVPLYAPENLAGLARLAPAFNTLLYEGKLPPVAGFAADQCHGDVCLARRPGTCDEMPGRFVTDIPPPLQGLKPIVPP